MRQLFFQQRLNLPGKQFLKGCQKKVIQLLKIIVSLFQEEVELILYKR